MMLLLLLAVAFALAAYLVGEVGDLSGKRQRRRCGRRARSYGRVRPARRRRSPATLPASGSSCRRPPGSPRSPSPEPEVLRRRDPVKLLAAGLSQRIQPQAYLAVKGGLGVSGLMVGLTAGLRKAPASASVLLLFGAAGFMVPDVLLMSKARSRRDAIRGQLPDALDLLAVSVEAGMGFDGAIAKLTEHMDGALVDEFTMTLGEMRIGENRQDALKKMAERVQAPEMSAFVRSIVQADQLGISLGRILRVQAADSRLRRQAAAEERAMKAPIKMLFPTVLFIFPAMFVVILGPAMLNLSQVF